MGSARRTFLGATLGALAAGALGTARAQRPAGNRRRFVILHLWGGMDSIYTIDPKVRADVDADVDLPYSQDAIHTVGNVALGPHFAALAPWASRLAIVKGIALETLAHETGTKQMLRLKTNVTEKTPGLLELIGLHRDAQPVGSVTMTDGSSQYYSPHSFADSPTNAQLDTTLDRMDGYSQRELGSMARAFHAQAERLHDARTPELANTRLTLDECSAFFTRFASLPGYKEQSWADTGSGPDSPDGYAAGQMQRLLWLLENDLTRSVFLALPYDWDSHDRNALRQTKGNGMAVRMIARLLAELSKRRNSDGLLADNTVVLVGSEMGRYPYLNRIGGKDHLPEASYLMFGPGVKPGVYGRTGKHMEALPVSLRTGRDTATGGRRIVLDDIGATLLRLADLDPSLYGYRGTPLEFVLA